MIGKETQQGGMGAEGLEDGPEEGFSHHAGVEEMLLFFPETLAVVSDTGVPQGELTIDVQRGKYRDDQGILTHCVMVHASSRGYIDKSLCGSSLLGRFPLPAALYHIFPPRAPLQSM